jgi:hypothetical protein
MYTNFWNHETRIKNTTIAFSRSLSSNPPSVFEDRPLGQALDEITLYAIVSQLHREVAEQSLTLTQQEVFHVQSQITRAPQILHQRKIPYLERIVIDLALLADPKEAEKIELALCRVRVRVAARRDVEAVTTKGLFASFVFALECEASPVEVEASVTPRAALIQDMLDDMLLPRHRLPVLLRPCSLRRHRRRLRDAVLCHGNTHAKALLGGQVVHEAPLGQRMGQGSVGVACGAVCPDATHVLFVVGNFLAHVPISAGGACKVIVVPNMSGIRALQAFGRLHIVVAHTASAQLGGLPMPVNVGQRVDLCHLQAQRIKPGFGRCDLAVLGFKFAQLLKHGQNQNAILICGEAVGGQLHESPFHGRRPIPGAWIKSIEQIALLVLDEVGVKLFFSCPSFLVLRKMLGSLYV